MSLPSRLATLLLTVALLLPSGLAPYTPVAAQDDRQTIFSIWDLVPAHATFAVELNTDPESEQWAVAAANLEAGGLEDLIYGTVAQLFASTDLPPALLDPEQSTLLGGRIVAAGWGPAGDPLNQAAVFFETDNAEAAYRTLVASLISDVPAEVTEVETPTGSMAFGDPFGLTILRVGNIVIAGEGLGIEEVVRVQGGGMPALSRFEPFTTTRDEQPEDAVAWAYLNGPAVGGRLPEILFGLGSVQTSDIALATFLTAPFLDAQSSLSVRATEDGFALHLVQQPSPLSTRPLPASGASDNLAESVSNDAHVFASGTDLGENPILNDLITQLGIAVVAGMQNPDFDPNTPIFDQIRELTGIDLQAELLDQLRGDYLIALSAEGVDSPGQVAGIVMSDLEEPETVNGLLRLIRLGLSAGLAEDTSGIEWTTEEVEGGSLLVFLIDATPAPVRLAVGIVHDQLVISLGDGFETLLNPADGESLADLDRFETAMDALPEPEAANLYVDLQQVIALAGQTALEPPDTSYLPEGPQFASLAGIQAMVASSYEDDDLAVTDVLLNIVPQEAAPEPSPESSVEPDPSAEASPEGNGGDTGLIVESAVVAGPEDASTISVSPTGEYLLIDDGDRPCLVSAIDPVIEPTLCGPAPFPPVDKDRVGWSPDGHAVAFTEDALRFLYDSDIWVIDADAGTVTNFTEDNWEDDIFATGDEDLSQVHVDIAPVWSPAGDRIAFGRTPADADPRPTDIIVIDVATGDLSDPIRFGDEPWLTYGGALWTEDDELLVSRNSVDRTDINNGLYRLDLTTGEAELVFTRDDPDYRTIIPAQMIDDERLLIAYPYVMGMMDGRCAWSILDLASGDETELTANDRCVYSAGVSPDGSRLLIGVQGGPRLAVMDLATGDVIDVADDPLEEYFPETTPMTGANFVSYANVIPWTDEQTAWFYIGANRVIRVDFAVTGNG
ncbi:MAG: DUF3352 domain-containing protein [Chloroflexota bacterium]|nr:DUF3352 domain-containing protein [Chloroflexota bacterium]